MVWLVHGILTNGDDSVNRLADDLAMRGLTSRTYQYPHNGLLDQRSQRKRTENARGLMQRVGAQDHVVGHSNGCGVVHGAMNLGARFDRVFLFGAALDSDVLWPKRGAKKINVIHNKRDKALTLGWLLPWHAFGSLGKIGYQGEFDQRIHSISAFADNTVDKSNHSHYFTDTARRRRWAEYIAERVR